MPEALSASSSAGSAALLHTLTASARRLCRLQYDDFIERLNGRFAYCAANADGPVVAAYYTGVQQQLAQRREAFGSLLDACLRQGLENAVQAAAEQGDSRLRNGAMDLSLFTFDAMERKVLIDNLSQKLDATDPQVLAALGLRINHLLHGEVLGVAQNPFRSEVFLKAVAEAWQQFDANPITQDMVLRQMRVGVFLQLGPIWKGLNSELLAHKVLPDAEEIHRRRVAEPVLPSAPGIKHRLQQWLAPVGTMNVIDEHAANLLDRIVEYLASEKLVQQDVAAQLMALREPLREAARTDRSFFFDALHPARRMSEAVLAAALDCTVGGELHLALQRAVESAQRGRAFDDIAADLEEAIAQQEQAAQSQIEAKSAEALAQEKRAQLLQCAQEEVLTRIDGGALPPYLEHFLQWQWTRVLMFACSVRDSKPEAWPRALQAMDALVRSVQPKAGATERQELLNALPALLAALNTWLNAVRWDGDERHAFFETLAEQHAKVVRAPEDPVPQQEVSPQVQAQRAAWRAQHEARIECARQFAPLVAGCWFEFVRNDGSRVNCRLAWISPQRSRFVFTGRQGQLTFVLADEALAQAMKMKRTRLIAEGSLIERALEASLDTLA